MDFQTVLSSTSNDSTTLSRFQTVDPSKMPDSPIPGFPVEFSTQKTLHRESDDMFTVTTQYEKVIGPYRVFATNYKTFLLEGYARDTKTDNDFGQGVGVTLKTNAGFGDDIALQTGKILFWAAVPIFPIILPPDADRSGYLPQPGPAETFIAALIPWANMRRLYPTGRWPDGVDLKVMDKDAALNSTISLFRLRPGRRTPFFRIPASTHLYVLEGSVVLVVPGAGSFTLMTNQYAFIPHNLVLNLCNPKSYVGPLPRN